MTNNTIYLDPNQVPAQLRGQYAGRTFRAVVCEHVDVPATAGLWDGGSRETFRAVRFDDGAEVPLSDNIGPPWGSQRQERRFQLQPGIVVIEHVMFSGKDLGLRFYVHPANAPAFMPAPAPDLGRVEKLVLQSRSYKSSYNGKDRYQLMRDECRYRASGLEAFPSRAEWTAAEESLKARGLLSKIGALTTAGKNAKREM